MKEPAWELYQKSHGKYDKYFDYYECRIEESTFYKRIPKEGYEHLQFDHRPIEEIEKDMI